MQQPVLYAAFGTQADISVDQLSEIAIGLDKSVVNFLWVIRRTGGSSWCTLDLLVEKICGEDVN